MASIKAIISYVKLHATVEPVETAMRIVATVFPRIRAFVEHQELHATVGESKFVVTYSVWDDGDSEWDVVDGVPRTLWDIGLR